MSIMRSVSVDVLRDILDAIPVGILVTGPTDKDTPIELVNAEFTRLTGFTSEELLGKNPRCLQPPGLSGSYATARRALAGRICDGKPCVGRLINRRRDGSHYWAECRIRPIFDENGQNIHWIGAQVDVSDRVSAERQLANTLHTFVDQEIELLNNLLWKKSPSAALIGGRLTRLAEATANHWRGIESVTLMRSARLAMIGFIVEDDKVIEAVDREKKLTVDEDKALSSYPQQGAEIVLTLPGLKNEVEAVSRHRFVNHPAAPDLTTVDPGIPMKLCQVLTVLSMFDTHIRRRLSLIDAFDRTRADASDIDPAVLEECHTLLPILAEKGWPERWETVTVDVLQLVPGALTNQDIVDTQGRLLVRLGQQLTEGAVFRIKQLAHEGRVVGPIQITRHCSKAA